VKGGKYVRLGISSHNHHFFGDISHWFISEIGGIHVNPHRNNTGEVLISPKFISKLEHAKAFHILTTGKVEVSWKRMYDKIVLNITADKGVKGKIVLENGYVFENALSYKDLANGSYIISKAHS
jgi:alpha-L-rhamnosidase